jgi:hypothetical protein
MVALTEKCEYDALLGTVTVNVVVRVTPSSPEPMRTVWRLPR